MSEHAIESLIRTAHEQRLTRREVLRRAVALGLGAPAIAQVLAACGGASNPSSGSSTHTVGVSSSGGTSTSSSAAASPSAPNAGQKGGTLKIALIGDLTTMDIHQTTGSDVALVSLNMTEPLFAWDANFKLIPMLAESLETSSDNLTNTLKLRKGVPFHNGQEMKAADVLASMKRWAGLSGLGKSLMNAVASIKTVDDYTLEFKMMTPFGVFGPALAFNHQCCVIYPKSVIDAIGSKPIDKPIGTGPYKFVERQPDRFIRLERFPDYAALPGEALGYGGHKYAYVDQIEFTPVPDEAALIAGLQAGDYDLPESISSDQYNTLKAAPNLVAQVLPPSSWGVFILNLKQGLMTNAKLRQAFQATLDTGPICDAGFGKGFYRLSPSLMMRETVWKSDAGAKLYDQHDPDLAKRLLKEANYDGTPIRFVCTKQYLDHYNRTVVAKQQLEAVGFKVNLLVYDWATVLSQQTDPTKWDATTTGIAFRPDPALYPIFEMCSFAGWWCSSDTTALVNQLRSESDFQTRFGIWEQIQTNFYQEVPEIKGGDSYVTFVHAKRVQNLSSQSQLGPIIWNVWLKS